MKNIIIKRKIKKKKIANIKKNISAINFYIINWKKILAKFLAKIVVKIEVSKILTLLTI